MPAQLLTVGHKTLTWAIHGHKVRPVHGPVHRHLDLPNYLVSASYGLIWHGIIQHQQKHENRTFQWEDVFWFCQRRDKFLVSSPGDRIRVTFEMGKEE